MSKVASVVRFHNLNLSSACKLFGITETGEVANTGFRFGDHTTQNRSEITFHGQIHPFGDHLLPIEKPTASGNVVATINGVETKLDLSIEEFGDNIRLDIIPSPEVTQEQLDNLLKLVVENLKPIVS